MQNFENNVPSPSRAEQLQADIEALRKNKIANMSDPTYAAEIQDAIEEREAQLRELNGTVQ